MSSRADAPLYRGKGKANPNGAADLPVIDPGALRGAPGYRASPNLAAAVEVALRLGMPLLLTGEPGCGKSLLADSVAWELGLGEPLRYVVKSDTQGRDLLYTHDALARFQTSGDAPDPRRFITFNALGKAILHAKPRSFAETDLGLPMDRVQHPGEPRRSVVLIDEVDKAPRDVPNDLLTEIEEMRFRIPEIEATLGKNVSIALAASDDENREAELPFRPIVIITSNSEKALPEAFLRRCIYYHVPFPRFESELSDAEHEAGAVTVEKIVDARLASRFGTQGNPLVDEALGLFRTLRRTQTPLKRRPSLAELLNWLEFLSAKEPLPRSLKALGREQVVLGVCTILLKNLDDQTRGASLVDDWWKSSNPT